MTTVENVAGVIAFLGLCASPFAIYALMKWEGRCKSPKCGSLLNWVYTSYEKDFADPSKELEVRHTQCFNCGHTELLGKSPKLDVQPMPYTTSIEY